MTERDGQRTHRPQGVVDGRLIPRRAAVEDLAAGEEHLLYSAERDEASALNRSAAEIWKLCDGTRTAAAISRTLEEQYGVENQCLWSDVSKTLAVLQTRGLIVWTDQPSHRP